MYRCQFVTAAFRHIISQLYFGRCKCIICKHNFFFRSGDSLTVCKFIFHQKICWDHNICTVFYKVSDLCNCFSFKACAAFTVDCILMWFNETILYSKCNLTCTKPQILGMFHSIFFTVRCFKDNTHHICCCWLIWIVVTKFYADLIVSPWRGCCDRRGNIQLFCFCGHCCQCSVTIQHLVFA